jgi:hypothetical protein
MNVRYPGPPPLEAAGREIDRLKKLVDTLNHRLGQKDTVPFSDYAALAERYLALSDKYIALANESTETMNLCRAVVAADHTRRERDYWRGRVRDLETAAARARIADVTKHLDD